MQSVIQLHDLPPRLDLLFTVWCPTKKQAIAKLNQILLQKEAI